MPRPTPQPSTVVAFPDDSTPDIQAILAEVKQGCPAHEQRLQHARDVADFYDGQSEKFVAFKPSEDALSWLTRPKRVSFIARQAVNKLTGHLYKPGPRKRLVADDPDVDRWYANVCQDIALNSVMQQADRLATLHGLCMLGVYPTGNMRRPINYHLFPRQDFVFWANPDDPRVPVAVCTVTKMGTEKTRYRLWTKTHYYTFFKGKSWGYTPGGWNVARYDPEKSGPHPYGVLPFCFITHELPTTELETKGLGSLLAKINRALNIDKSNLAHWVHHYARPLGFVSGVGPEWRPKFIDGGFVPLVVRHDSTEDAPVIPEARYLESQIDIAAIAAYIRGEANQALAELDIPLSISVQEDGGGGAMSRSGMAIAADEAGLITYAKGRQPLFERHEQAFFKLVCRVGSSEAGNMGAFAANLAMMADDPSLRVAWPEVQIDLPGDARDAADQWELDTGITDPIEILMRRQGLDEAEAVVAYQKTSARRKMAEALAEDPTLPVEDVIATFTEYAGEEPGEEGDELMLDGGDDPDAIPGDMGIADEAEDSPGSGGANSVGIDVTYANGYRPDTPIPADPTLGLGGTEV